MALPPNFPESPHAILAPNERWEPGRGDLFEMLPPLVSVRSAPTPLGVASTSVVAEVLPRV